MTKNINGIQVDISKYVGEGLPDLRWQPLVIQTLMNMESSFDWREIHE